MPLSRIHSSALTHHSRKTVGHVTASFNPNLREVDACRALQEDVTHESARIFRLMSWMNWGHSGMSKAHVAWRKDNGGVSIEAP